MDSRLIASAILSGLIITAAGMAGCNREDNISISIPSADSISVNSGNVDDSLVSDTGAAPDDDIISVNIYVSGRIDSSPDSNASVGEKGTVDMETSKSDHFSEKNTAPVRDISHEGTDARDNTQETVNEEIIMDNNTHTSASYVKDELICLADTKEEAEGIASLYGITLYSFDAGVAVFKTNEDPESVIKRGRDNGYPDLDLNYIMTIMPSPGGPQ
jgi:hypothetical protein